jgi:Mg/Co/Ni transporter MgtE
MQDYEREHFLKVYPQLTAEERREIVQSLPMEDRRKLVESLSPEERLAGLPLEVIRNYLEKQAAKSPPATRKTRKKK